MIHVPGIILTILGFIAVIGPLVFIHEMGHYLAGQLFGVKADIFSIGMGREIMGWTDRRGTRWKVSALPIGGYVKFAGDMGPASEPDPAWLRLPPEERAKTLQGKPVWQRFIIVAAGPITNFLLAIAIFAGFFAAYGVPRTPTVIANIVKGSAAEAAGLHIGDRIVAVAGRSVDRFEDVAQIVFLRPGRPLPLVYERAGATKIVQVTPQRIVDVDAAGNRAERGLLGVSPGMAVNVRLGVVGTLGAAVDATWGTVRMMVDVIGQIVGGERSARELGGPLKIAQYSGETVSLGLLPFIRFMALISINLGFINLLPIPLLDGGHLFFYLIEGVWRRPLPAQAQEWAFRSGLALLLGFMLFVTVNDLASFGLFRKLAGLIG
ncbi:RIP metalloprotease RseP [Sphingomonas nostoxanthinifaciens]|uniref:RIP metalloprotease RseP n=1 Tax=Sphingomonas nostoxanthinifaciens TaxID=2872652 RepID=UPI001CC1EB31|nr:RIP metalloprotease RseP [Sphingomonas nostoxanthinifaciens]UAK25347.1 RIP metalloprotease RseP [Sphingomonas nostoxanthinifaciens]